MKRIFKDNDKWFKLLVNFVIFVFSFFVFYFSSFFTS